MEKEKFGIYLIKNKINNKVYVGSAVNIKVRWRNHKNKLRKRIHYNLHLQSAWDKYGEENFEFKILEEIEDDNALIEREQYWIDFYKSYERELGYNICPKAKSCLGRFLSETTKQKLSISHKNKIVLEETKQKISESTMGEKNHFFGKRHTDISKKKMSESHKILELGEKNHFFGKRHTDISKKKMSESHKGNLAGEKHPNSKLIWVQVYEIRNKWNSGNYKRKELAEEYNISYSAITHIINNKTWKEEI